MFSVCFDTETTGLSPFGEDADEILTISAIDRKGNVLFDGLYRPAHKKEWPYASRVNGIYPADVKDAPTIESDLPALKELFAKADEVIGYNVGFDLGFLAAIGVVPREDAVITDTMLDYAREIGKWDEFHGDYKWHKLVEAADHIGYEWTGKAHGSLADARATLAVQEWVESR